MPGVSYAIRNNIIYEGNADRHNLTLRGLNPILAFEEDDQTDPNGRCRLIETGNTFSIQRATAAGWASVDEMLHIDCSNMRITLAGLVLQSVTTGITASTTQTQGQGALTSSVNVVATVANTNDTVTLPSAGAGIRVVIINNGANTLRIFPATGDDAGSGVNTAITLAAGLTIQLLALDATTWREEVGTDTHNQSHDHSAAGDGTTLTPATLNIPNTATPAQTAEGQAVWDSDNDLLTVGDGTSRKTMVDTDSTQTVGGKTLTTPTISATGFTNANHAHAAANSGGQIALSNTTVSGLTDGQVLKATGAASHAFEDDDFGINFIIDGGGATITTGVKGFIELPFAGVIESVRLLADQSGSIVVDIWKDTYANYPPTDADSITASAVPTITTATKSEDATLTGWTTTFSAGDILGFNVDSVTTCQRVTLSLRGRKT